jgi:hypothetical protein
MGRIIPEDQKDGVRQRLLVFLEEPDFAVCPLSPINAHFISQSLIVDCPTPTLTPRVRS